MNEERLPHKIMEWCPPVRRKKGIPRNSWIHDLPSVRGKRINNMEWVNKEEWRRKIKLLAEKDVKTLILCI